MYCIDIERCIHGWCLHRRTNTAVTEALLCPVIWQLSRQAHETTSHCTLLETYGPAVSIRVRKDSTGNHICAVCCRYQKDASIRGLSTTYKCASGILPDCTPGHDRCPVWKVCACIHQQVQNFTVIAIDAAAATLLAFLHWLVHNPLLHVMTCLTMCSGRIPNGKNSRGGGMVSCRLLSIPG